MIIPCHSQKETNVQKAINAKEDNDMEISVIIDNQVVYNQEYTKSTVFKVVVMLLVMFSNPAFKTMLQNTTKL